MSKSIYIQPIFSALALFASFHAAPLHAQPSVVCSVATADETHQTIHRPKSNPLVMDTVNTDNGFRFSAILLESPRKFKSYVYYESKDRFVLISKQELLLSDKWCGEKLGVGEAYSHYLENHLSHECEYWCVE